MLLALTLAGCGVHDSQQSTGQDDPATTTVARILPGTGRPPVIIGDKNFSEQFILGELYAEALSAQGFTVTLNKNIGSTQISMLALANGQLDMYPEDVGIFNADVAGDSAAFPTAHAAFETAQHYALAHGLRLLRPTPFSDSNAIAVLAGYGVEHHLRTIVDLGPLENMLTLGAPLQFQDSSSGLPGIESAYGVVPAHFQSVAVGQQYQALQDGSVQAADVFTTDAQLASGQYELLRDPRHVFGYENVVPVVSQQALLAEGPAFADTINRVSATLTTESMRLLNADVEVYNETPASVARQFLLTHGLLPQ